MLLAAIHSFLAFFYVDALPVAAAVAGIAFVWMWYFIGDANVATYWIVWPAGLGVAAVARWHMRRLRTLALLPDSNVTPRQMLPAIVVVFCFTWYTLNIEDPASALIEPFPIGAVLSLLIATPVLLVFEIADHMGGTATALSFQLISAHWHAWLALCAIVALDLVAWRHAWLLAVVGGGVLLTFVAVRFMLRAAR